MSIRIGRTLPPAVAPISFGGIANGFHAMLRGDKAQQNFSDRLKGYFKVKHCFLLSSGKASLALILQSLKEQYPEKDEVLIPAFTCYSVPAAIVRAGLKIRICDVEPDSLDFDYDELTRHLSASNLLCVLPTHLFGVTANISRIREIVGSRDITIIEDAAQAMGGEYLGHKAGTLGDVGFFSLERGKPLSTVEGGIIITNSDELATVMKTHIDELPSYTLFEQLLLAAYAIVISVFSHPELFWFPRSLPFLGLGETHYVPNFSIKRMSAFQAGLAKGWEKRLNIFFQVRRRNANHLHRSGIHAAGVAKPHANDLIRYPVMVSSKNEKRGILLKSNCFGLGLADVYPDTVDRIEGLRGRDIIGDATKARSITERMITVPIHPYVTESDIERIIPHVRKAGDFMVGRNLEKSKEA